MLLAEIVTTSACKLPDLLPVYPVVLGAGCTECSVARVGSLLGCDSQEILCQVWDLLRALLHQQHLLQL